MLAAGMGEGAGAVAGAIWGLEEKSRGVGE